MLHEFAHTPELAGLAIEVERDGERLRRRVVGPCGPWRAHRVHASFAWLDRVRPLRIDAREGIWSLLHCSAARRTGLRPTGDGPRRRGAAARSGAAAAAPLTVDGFTRTVAESLAAGSGNVTVTGGEPLVSPHLGELVTHMPADRVGAG